MGIQDLIITPIFIAIFLIIAYAIRPVLTDDVTKKYFIPALVCKFIGAITLGIVYFFYYKGGDTINYFDHGSKYIYEAFYNDPIVGLKLIFAEGIHTGDVIKYSSKIWFYRDQASYFVIRVAGVFDLFTIHTYTATACMFAFASFLGLWVMFNTFYRICSKLHRSFAIAIFFVPSLIFWGSGIMKDTITLSALGWLTYAIFNIFVFRRRIVFSILCLLVSFYVIYTVKIYIVLCFVPVTVFYLLTKNSIKYSHISVYKYVAKPLIIAMALLIGYFGVSKIGENNHRYSIEKLSHTAEITAQWINYVSITQGGATYSLGDTDFSPLGIIRKTPLAIWVALFRPHPWEIRNPIMVLASLEATIMLFFAVYIFQKSGVKNVIKIVRKSPLIKFCLSFAVFFAFAVGISTYNFGSLMRYKIPLIPFFLISLYLIQYYLKGVKGAAKN